jgi:hypothetical protein
LLDAIGSRAIAVGVEPPHRNRRIATLREDAVHDVSILIGVTGLGPKDALTLPKTVYKDGEIATRRSKTGEPVYWPAPGPLKEVLVNAPVHDALTLCANSKGRPWTLSGFRASWRPERTIADALGQRTIEVARHYARGADLRPKMRGVAAAFEREVNERRTKAVKPSGKKCQTFWYLDRRV